MSALRPDWFSTRVQLGEAASADVGVVIVANVKEKSTPLSDYDGDSIISEFLSNQELDDVVEYFESAGLYCHVLIDEERFLDWLVQGHPFPRRHAVVYNLAQNGTGPARLTTVAALCRLNGLPLADSEAYGVALAQHKFHSLSLLSNLECRSRAVGPLETMDGGRMHHPQISSLLQNLPLIRRASALTMRAFFR